MMNQEYFKELWQMGELKSIQKDVDNSWRHGCYISEVFEYKGEYYGCSYKVSNDGETHELRDIDSDIQLTELEAIEVKPIKYIERNK